MSDIKKLMAAHHEKLLAACVEYRAKLDELERENAALRKALDAARGYDNENAKDFSTALYDGSYVVPAAIDAAKKEAQP